ncbi:MAG: DNA (cytosine-5-)-methyltransferase [Christensenellaceae bacterium]|jgi:DNA (cytosine-5)-methyltransferase 1|nr:DNA (cytosine-5-)-methyltransferase [Christensenellaceae bacterium]
MTYKTIDLCAGIGGMRRGYELAGNFVNVLSAENDLTACKIYKHLFGDDPYNDITKTEFKDKVKKIDYDILLAGFPCQAFSRAGKQKGFEDEERGIIFHHIEEIIRDTKPKAFLLENVDHLLTHDDGNTIAHILNTLTKDLKYKIIGVSETENKKMVYSAKTLVRNSKNFGVPQNRPRIYLMGFRNDIAKNFGNSNFELPLKSEFTVYNSLTDVLYTDVKDRYFMSSGYLETLEKHKARQKLNGNGYGYRIVNSKEIERPIANTLLATGGSGKERNLIYDEKKGVAGKIIQGKHTPLNSKHIRVMTPEEWGKLQGFINYAFITNDKDMFAFPDGIKDAAKYKVFGNAVTIPVIETLAKYMKSILDIYCTE